jgi:hypothetical protein
MEAPFFLAHGQTVIGVELHVYLLSAFGIFFRVWNACSLDSFLFVHGLFCLCGLCGLLAKSLTAHVLPALSAWTATHPSC